MKNIFNKPLVTVVTVVFNFNNEIEDTILSVINQSYDNTEYIVIDGGSTDGTLDIVKRYQHKIKKLISEPDTGIFDAMNKSLKLATGDFIIFMNAGDRFCSINVIENMVAEMKNLDLVYYGNAIFTNKINNIQMHRGGYFSKYRLSQINLCHQTIFYPKVAYKNNDFDLNYRTYADWPYNIKLFSKTKFIYLDQDVVYFDNSGISALNEDAVFKKNRLKLVYKFLGADVVLYLSLNKIKNIVLSLFKNREVNQL